MQIATFVLAVVGTALAAASLVWQAATYVLAGGRAQVDLQVGALNPHGHGMMTAQPCDYDKVWTEQLAEQGYTRPVVSVRVRNVGRLPVTVQRWSLDCLQEVVQGGGLFRSLFEHRGTVAGLVPIADSIGPSLPHRLEPGASETWSVDAQAVHAFAEVNRKTFKLTTAELVGKVELGTGRTHKTRRSIRF